MQGRALFGLVFAVRFGLEWSVTAWRVGARSGLARNGKVISVRRGVVA